MSAMTPLPPDPAELLLCQMPGLNTQSLLRLVAHYGSASSVLAAPSGELRAAGLLPQVVARLVAGRRQIETVAAGLKGLARLGITPIPLLSAGYPGRLRDAPDPPALIYVQGRWPVEEPLVALRLSADVEEAQAAAIREWIREFPVVGIAVGSVANLELLPNDGAVAVAPYGLMLAAQRLPTLFRATVQAGRATVMSAVAVNVPPDGASTQQAEHLLATLADAEVVLDLDMAHRQAGRPSFGLDLGQADRAPGLKWIRNDRAGLKGVAQALGIFATAEGTMHQEQLW